MTQEQAERERERMAEEHPESTWLVAEQEPGDWQLVRVGLPSSDANTVESTEARPKSDHVEDQRSAQALKNPYGNF